MKDKLVTVAHFEDYIEANMARQWLEDEGIKAFVMGENFGNVYSGLAGLVDIELQTAASEAEEARQILAAHTPPPAQPGADGDFDEGFDEDEPAEGPADGQE